MNKFTIFMQAFCLISIIIVNTVNAGVFKWVDENGNTHFGDRPESNSSEKVIVGKKRGPDKFTTERLKRQNLFLEDRQLEREEKNQQKNEARKKEKENQKKCDDANKRLALLEKQVRLYQKGTNDEKIFLSDKDREQEKSKIKRYKKEVCS